MKEALQVIISQLLRIIFMIINIIQNGGKLWYYICKVTDSFTKCCTLNSTLNHKIIAHWICRPMIRNVALLKWCFNTFRFFSWIWCLGTGSQYFALLKTVWLLLILWFSLFDVSFSTRLYYLYVIQSILVFHLCTHLPQAVIFLM